MIYGLTEGVQFHPGLYTGFGMFFYFAVNISDAVPKDFIFSVNWNLYNYSSNFPYFTGFPACSLVK